MEMDMDAIKQKWPGLQKAIDTGIESHDGREEQLLAFILAHDEAELDKFRGSPKRLLSAIDSFSSTREFLISVGPHKARILSELLSRERPEVVLELGGYLAYSAILFADAWLRDGDASSNSNKKKFHIWSVELEARFARIAEKLIELAGLQEYITVVVGSSDTVVKDLYHTKQIDRIDLLFLDHQEDLYVSDFLTCRELGLLKEGAVVVADNVVRPGAPEYRDLVRGDESLSSEGIAALIQPGDLQDEIEITRVLPDRK